MKIAIATDDNETISLHLRRATQYTVLAVIDGNIKNHLDRLDRKM